VHIKGFSFAKQNRAFQRNPAAECDRIYGDAFKIADDRVEGIGNNVSLEFDCMDFTDDGATKLVICGRSPIEKNTIHIRFEGDGADIRQLAEFAQSAGYVERKFGLNRVAGLKKVTFIFLPGSNFDFAWFRFER
jgi:beta-galactosidase